MTDLDDLAEFPSVTRLETTDLVLGGAGGASNRAPGQLTKRTRWLRERLETMLVHKVLRGTTHDLTTLADAVTGVRVVAGEDYSGATATTLVLPKGQFLVVNECRWPMAIRGPSGVTRTLAARVSPNASAARFYVDDVDTMVVGAGTPPMRDVEVTSVAPATADSTATTTLTVTGRGFLGAIDVQVNVTSIAYTVINDTTMTVDVDGPAIGAVAGPGSVQVFRTGGENAILSPAFTFT